MKRPIRVELPEDPPPIGRDAARVLLELLRVVEATCPDCTRPNQRKETER